MHKNSRTDRVNVLGVNVHPITLHDATETIQTWIRDRTPNYVCVTGVHGIMESWRDPDLRRIHNAAGLVTPDGMPLVWLSHFYGFRHVTRVYGPDLMLAMTALSAQHGYRNYYLGGGPGTADRLKAVLTRKYPGLRVVGTSSPPFRPLRPEEDESLIRQINATRPDIVWLGLSCPKQEHWMAAHLGKLTAPVMVGVGAAFDFLSGEKAQAPRWMQSSGTEWLFRMASEPRRLAGRYLRNNPLFLYLILRQILTARKV
jgi:N-acetylglucosaminyldiphosphoundecaprenol N-acetyl-beta-D-mannosaminyltransferase